MRGLCLSLVLVGLALALPLGRLLLGLGHRFGQLDRPGGEGHKRHERTVPNTGGIAIFLAIALPLLAAIVTVWLAPAAFWTGVLAPAAPHMEGFKQQTPMALGVLGCLAVMHVMGLIDDRKALGPWSKLGVQLAVAVILALFLDMRIMEFLGAYGLWGVAASVALSVLWIVVINNAMNFLDNMDGLAGGVGAIIAALYLAATLIHGQWFVAALAALLLGALLGFLFFNFPPARMFMGDGGSLVMGLLLAIISIRTTYFDPERPAAGPVHVHAVLMPLMVMAVPLYDFVSVTLIRTAQGRSPLRGDQSHFSHRLVRRGLSRRTAVLVIWLCTLATGISGVMIGSLSTWQAVLAASQTLAVLALLALLERTPAVSE